jgi:hypothetical protein
LSKTHGPFQANIILLEVQNFKLRATFAEESSNVKEVVVVYAHITQIQRIQPTWYFEEV